MFCSYFIINFFFNFFNSLFGKIKAEELSHRRLIDIFFMALALFIWAALPSDLTAFITQMFVERFRNLIFEYPHSRRQEKEADYVGFLLAARVNKQKKIIRLIFKFFMFFHVRKLRHALTFDNRLTCGNA